MQLCMKSKIECSRGGSKMSKLWKNTLGFVLSFSLLMGNCIFVSAEEREELREQQFENYEKTVEMLFRENKLTNMQEEKVAADLEILRNVGISIGSVEELQVKQSEIIYKMVFDEKTVNEIKLDVNEDKDVIMNVSENNITNELIFMADGSLYLDGKKVDVKNSEITYELMPRTGGFEWYSESDAPSYLQNASYGSYTLTAQAADVQLATKIENITYAACVAALTYSSGIYGAFVGFGVSAFRELQTENPDATDLSHKVYTAKCPNNPRYLKRKTYVYTEKNYGGTMVISYSYGVLI